MCYYKLVLLNFEVDLLDNLFFYILVLDVLGKDGIWGEVGINSKNVVMSVIEIIIMNFCVLGVDFLVLDGIGEEDIFILVFFYI